MYKFLHSHFVTLKIVRNFIFEKIITSVYSHFIPCTNFYIAIYHFENVLGRENKI